MALVAEGPDKGKLCVIVDVINQRSVSCFRANYGGPTVGRDHVAIVVCVKQSSVSSWTQRLCTFSFMTSSVLPGSR